MPAFAFEGGAVWVSCYVPRSFGVGRIRYGVQGHRTSEELLDHSQYRLLIEHLACGQWRAFCAVVTSEAGAKVREQVLTVKGMCNGGLQN